MSRQITAAVLHIAAFVLALGGNRGFSPWLPLSLAIVFLTIGVSYLVRGLRRRSE